MIHIVLSWHKMLLKQRAKYIDDTIVFYPEQSQKSAQNSERVQNIFSLTNLKLLFETMKRHILQWPIPVVVVVLKTIRLSRLVNTSNLDSDIRTFITYVLFSDQKASHLAKLQILATCCSFEEWQKNAYLAKLIAASCYLCPQLPGEKFFKITFKNHC